MWSKILESRIYLLSHREQGVPGTLRKNLGNGSFADFLATIVCQFYQIGRSPKSAQFWWYSRSGRSGPPIDRARSIGIRPDQSGLGPTRPEQTRLGVDVGDAFDRRPDFGEAPIGHDARKWCAPAPCLPRWTRRWQIWILLCLLQLLIKG